MEFWFELASAYSFLAATRMDAAARDAGVAIDWRPLELGPILRKYGWNDPRLNLEPVRARYMWRDIARQADPFGMKFEKPSVFPRDSLPAARVAYVALREPWGTEVVRAIYRANFGEDRDISQRSVLTSILEKLGVDPIRVLEQADSPETAAALRRQSEEGADKGVFGVPSFVVGDEIFWGNDRLEQALVWARRVQT